MVGVGVVGQSLSLSRRFVPVSVPVLLSVSVSLSLSGRFVSVLVSVLSVSVSLVGFCLLGTDEGLWHSPFSKSILAVMKRKSMKR